MKTNEELQKDVQDAIKFESLLNAAEIGVTVNDGIVTLRGNVNSYAKKFDTEHTVKNVSGVKAVVEKIKVKLGINWKKTDDEIAADILKLANWDFDKDGQNLTIEVEHGWVKLGGELRDNKDNFIKAVTSIIGVRGITNNFFIKSNILDDTEKNIIENALIRNPTSNEKHIQVQVLSNIVTLIGTVNSLFEKEEAGRLALNVDGVISVDNKLVIEYC